MPMSFNLRHTGVTPRLVIKKSETFTTLSARVERLLKVSPAGTGPQDY